MVRLLTALTAAAALVGLIYFMGVLDAPSTPTTISQPTGATPTQEADQPAPVSLTPAGPREAAAHSTSSGAPGDWVRGRVQVPPGQSPVANDLRAFAVPRAMGYYEFLRWEAGVPKPSQSFPVAEDGSFALPPDAGTHVSSDPGVLHVILRGRTLYSPRATPLHLAPEEAIALVEGAFVQGAVTGNNARDTDEPLRIDFTVAELQLDPLSLVGAQTIGPVPMTAADDDSFQFRALPAGHSYSVHAKHETLASTTADLPEVQAGDELTVTLELREGAQISGGVVDESGEAVAHAEVTVVSDGIFGTVGAMPKQKAQCDDRGLFHIQGLGPGEAKMRATADGYLESDLQAVDLLEREHVQDITLTLARGQSISGTLHWEEGQPAVDVTVQATFDVAHAMGLGGLNALRGANGTSNTDAQGAFTIQGLGKGPFVVKASSPRGERSEPTLGERGETSPAGERWQAQADGIPPGTTGVALVLSPPQGVKGQVVDAAGNPVTEFRLFHARSSEGPAGGLSAKVSKQSRTFDDDGGAFRLEGLSPGSYVAWVQDLAHASTEPVSFTVPQESDLLLEVNATARADGRVVGSDGTPIADATVKSSHGASLAALSSVGLEAASTTTLPDGRFQLEGIPAGPTQLVAEAEGWAKSDGLQVEFVPGGLQEGLRIELSLGGTLTGEVFTKEGKPAAGSMVTAVAMDSITSGAGLSQRITNSDSDGHFRLEHLQPGTWQVTAIQTGGDIDGEQDLGQLMSSLEIGQAEIINEETTHIVLGAPPADPVRLFGTVTLGGEPFTGASLSLFPEGRELYKNLAMDAVGADGQYEMILDGPGGYVANLQILGASPGQQSTIEYRLEIPGAAEHRHDFRLPLGRIAGVVRGPDGEPVQGERITLSLDGNARSDSMFGGQYSEWASDEAGQFEILPLRAGVYRLSAGGAPLMGLGQGRLGRTTLGGLILAEGQNLDNLVIDLSEPGSIALTLMGQEGGPVQGASVFVRDDTGRILEPFSMQTTGPGGVALLEALAPGRYTVVARTQSQCSPESAPVEVLAGQSTDLQLALQAGTIVKVQLQDKATREPTRGSVQVLDAAGRDYANLFGYADLKYLYLKGGFSPTEHRFGPLPPGKYVVHGEAAGGQAKKSVTLKGGERRVVMRLK